jgi:SWI/SNF-related matrix-associated actin-dependent regulator 1 of chromatin subfamily A
MANRPNTLIADEMGLGKTIQAIGLMNLDHTIKTVLVICPAGLKYHWRDKISEWSVASRSIQIINGKPPIDSDVWIVNYDVLKKHCESLKRSWDLIIIDEAHYIKNAQAQRTRLALEIAKKGKRILLLTGTPIVNRPAELWTLINLLAPMEFPSFWKFAHKYCDAHHNGWGWDFSGAKNLDQLQLRLRETMMVRRLKKDVLTELPAKRRQIIALQGELSDEERGFDDEWDDAIGAAEGKVEEEKLVGTEESYKAAVNHLASVRRMQFEAMSRIRHETALVKVPDVIEQVEGMLESVSKIVLFAHHRDVIDQLMSGLAQYNPVKIQGGDSPLERERAVNQFQTQENVRVFVGSIQAAGVGITLIAASTVVFAELDWVPGNVSQAEDRCHRIGQHDSVNVYHIVLDGSIDSRLAKTIVKKQAVIDQAMNEVVNRPEVSPVETIPVVDEGPAISEQEMADIMTMLRSVARFCDGAVALDGAGFNGADTRFGRALARLNSLTLRQARAAKRMLRKYRKQISEDVYNRMYAERGIIKEG